MVNEYDVFISYKSSNSSEVRAVAEKLIAKGIQVWFAEYQVLLENYENFQDAIDAGIDASRYALLFTNNEWVDSKYCRMEYERARSRLAPSHILEVRMPPEEKTYLTYPELQQGRSMVWGDDVEAVVEFIGESTDLDVSRPTRSLDELLATIATDSRRTTRFGISLQMGQFGRELRRARRGNGGEQYFLEAPLSDEYMLYAGVFINLFGRAIDEVVENIYAPYNKFYDPFTDFADREDYMFYRQFALPWLKKYDFQEGGLHLFVWQQRSGMALTYRSTNGCAWYRRYVATLVPQKGDNLGEVSVEFVLERRDSRSKQPIELATLCEFTPYFECLVATLEWDKRRMWRMEQAKLIFVSAILLAVGFWLYGTLGDFTLRSFTAFVVGGVAAQVGASFLLKGLWKLPLRIEYALGLRTGISQALDQWVGAFLGITIAALLTTMLGMFMFPPFFVGITLIHHAAYWMGMGFVAYLLGVNIPRMMGDIDL